VEVCVKSQPTAESDKNNNEEELQTWRKPMLCSPCASSLKGCPTIVNVHLVRSRSCSPLVISGLPLSGGFGTRWRWIH
jgi:hypothetical protein